MRLDAFLDKWMTYETGCSIANEYLRQPEQAWLRTSGESMNYDGGGLRGRGQDARGQGRAGRPSPSFSSLAAGADSGARAARADRDPDRARRRAGRIRPRGAEGEHVGWRGEARASLSVAEYQPTRAGCARRLRLAPRRGGRLRRAEPPGDVSNREMMSLGSTILRASSYHELHHVRRTAACAPA
jgi:hypothetical protein